MTTINRRGFITSSVVTAAGLTAGAPVVIKGIANASPNDRINIAVAGIRSRGGYYYGGTGHTANFSRIPNVRIAAVCDIDERLFPECVSKVEEMSGFRPKTVVDFRELLDDKEIDAVSIATPDHWHALQTIWACQAGKDVYVEKPISYTINEGRKMVQAARKYNRVVQTGTNGRSSRVVREAIKFLQEGKLGKLYMGRGVIFGFRDNIGHVKDSPIPEGVHWDLFLGPAPYRPFNENRFHYNWHWFWDTSTTEFGNNGVHVMDEVRWAMQKRVHPVKITCSGGLYVWDSDQEIPNIEVATFEYADGTIMEMEVRSLYTNAEDNEKKGCFLYGSEGWAHIGNDAFTTYFGKKSEPGFKITAKDLPPLESEAKGLDFHFQNFIDCMRTRRWQDLNAEIQEGHLSTTMMHLGNIAYRTGRKLTFNPYAEKFVNDDDANTYLTREYRHPYVMPKEV